MEYVPDFAPWDGRRVPVTFLGGYLGSGKTTLLNELLARTNLKLAVLVNDVGSVNIDVKLIKSSSGNAIELTDGCVCCSLSEGFQVAFDQIRAREEPPDHIVVELSGVAQPDRMRPWASTAGFKLDGVVILVDSEQFLEQIDSELTGYKIQRQLEAADLLVLTKTDLVSGEMLVEVENRVEQLVPGRKVVHSSTPSAFAAILELGGRQHGSDADVPAMSLFDSHSVEVETVPTGESFTVAALNKIVADLTADKNVVRVKGIIETEDAGMQLVHVVGNRQSITTLPQAEMASATDLVVIRIE